MERECDRQSHGGVAAPVHLFVVTKVELSAEGIAKLSFLLYSGCSQSPVVQILTTTVGACGVHFTVNSALNVIAVHKHRLDLTKE